MKNIDKRKSIIEIGIQYFDFEFFKELVIYKYLCRDSLSKKEWKKLDNGIMFDSYHQWEDYILKKYENYNETKIIEFYKYLKNVKRKEEPVNEYWKIVLSLMMGAVAAEGVKSFWDEITCLKKVLQTFGNIEMSMFFAIVLEVLFLCGGFYFIYKFILKVREELIIKNFITDYQEVIMKLCNKEMDNMC